MSIGDPLTIEKMDEYGEWEHYMNAHALNVNKDRSRESYDAGGEQDTETVKFRIRWTRRLSEVEFDKPAYSVVWKGHRFDIRGYDDYQYQHRTVDLRCVSHG